MARARARARAESGKCQETIKKGGKCHSSTKTTPRKTVPPLSEIEQRVVIIKVPWGCDIAEGTSNQTNEWQA